MFLEARPGALCKGVVINYGEGGLQNGKTMGPQDRVELSAPPPPFKELKHFAPPPSIYLKLQATT